MTRAFVRMDDTGEQVEHRGLAGPVRADDPERLPLIEGDAQVVDHPHAPVGLREVLGRAV